MKEDDYDIVNIYDYLVYCNSKGMCRLSGMITKKQTVNLIPKDNSGMSPIHIDIIEEILKKIFPKRKKRLQDAEDEIDIFSNGYDFVIILPDKISINQYKALLNVISEVNRFENDYGRKLELTYNPESIIKEAKGKVVIDIEPNPKEKIIGTPHSGFENEKQLKSQILSAKHFDDKTKQRILKEASENNINKIKKLIKIRKKQI